MKVTINSMKRLRNTEMGNPMWEFRTDQGRFVTKANTSCAYQITGNEHGEHDITLSGRGTVVDFR